MTPEQEKKLDRVLVALEGDPKMGIKGIVTDVNDFKAHVNEKIKALDNYKEKDEKLKAKIAGGLVVGNTIGVPALIIAWDWFKTHFLK